MTDQIQAWSSVGLLVPIQGSLFDWDVIDC